MFFFKGDLLQGYFQGQLSQMIIKNKIKISDVKEFDEEMVVVHKSSHEISQRKLNKMVKNIYFT